MYLNSCHLDKQKVSRKINWLVFFFFFTVFESSPDDFSWLLWYSTFQMAVCPGLTQLLVLTLPSEQKYSVTFLLQNHSPLRRWHSGLSGWRCSQWRSLTFPSTQPSRINLGQILGCVIRMLLFLCRQDMKESWKFRGCKSFGIFEIPSLFLCGYLTAGQLRQGHLSSAPSGLCLLHVGLNGKISLGFSWAIRGSYWHQFSLVQSWFWSHTVASFGMEQTTLCHLYFICVWNTVLENEK